ncbi:axonemal dynein light chain domain-containing protein [Pochonia chlamydosporia 170]|uniref:Axonemal dynein light chain domain-containing protein n=1 Tax=Pochonia chlamydosporia 170 TaxID=1380566 RepID=A0A179F6H3_METCM|nr:axonemal dynein light chain domain-containing protein [Pochonia chlamydosporia 170]OAQ61002.1 axonemal dynein light chain domain-containing protein [Pochonia chlamydosporia 170]
MSRRFYLETSATGKQQFVSIKRSRSHGHHHHHHHHVEQDYYKVSVEEWNQIKERERCLEETNKSLVAEVSALKASLAAAQGEAHHLCHVVVPQLQHQIHLLTVDNESLRKTLDNACHHQGKRCRDEDKLKQTIDKLEKDKKDLKDENCSLKDKIKHLQRQLESGCGRRTSELLREIDYWRDQYRYWKDRYEDTKRNHDDICVTLDIRTEKMRAYEEILKRRRII